MKKETVSALSWCVSFFSIGQGFTSCRTYLKGVDYSSTISDLTNNLIKAYNENIDRHPQHFIEINEYIRYYILSVWAVADGRQIDYKFYNYLCNEYRTKVCEFITGELIDALCYIWSYVIDLTLGTVFE